MPRSLFPHSRLNFYKKCIYGFIVVGFLFERIISRHVFSGLLV